MGIYDRDYMKKRPSEGGGRGGDFSSDGLPPIVRKIGLALAILVAILIVAGLLVAILE